MIKKRIGIACAVFLLIVIAIVAVIVVLTKGGGLRAQAIIINSNGLSGVTGNIFI